MFSSGGPSVRFLTRYDGEVSEPLVGRQGVAVAVTFREMGSQKWGWFAVCFQLFVGYVLSMSVYRLGVLFAGGGFGVWTAVAILVDLFCLWMIFRPTRRKPV